MVLASIEYFCLMCERASSEKLSKVFRCTRGFSSRKIANHCFILDNFRLNIMEVEMKKLSMAFAFAASIFACSTASANVIRIVNQTPGCIRFFVNNKMYDVEPNLSYNSSFTATVPFDTAFLVAQFRTPQCGGVAMFSQQFVTTRPGQNLAVGSNGRFFYVMWQN